MSKDVPGGRIENLGKGERPSAASASPCHSWGTFNIPGALRDWLFGFSVGLAVPALGHVKCTKDFSDPWPQSSHLTGTVRIFQEACEIVLTLGTPAGVFRLNAPIRCLVDASSRRQDGR